MAINQQRQQNNQEDIFLRILEKSIFMKARDKMKMGKKKNEDDAATTKERDYLAPILKKLGIQNPTEVLDEDIAMQVKNEALRNLKERLLTRADIIQRRLDEEQRNLENAYVSVGFEFKGGGQVFEFRCNCHYQFFCLSFSKN